MTTYDVPTVLLGLGVMTLIGLGGWALLGAGKNRTYALTKDPFWMDLYLFILGASGIFFLCMLIGGEVPQVLFRLN